MSNTKAGECDADRDCNSLRTRGAARGRIKLGTDVRGEGRDVSRKSRLTLYIVLDYPTYFITAGPGQGDLSAIESTVTASQKAHQHGVEGESAEYRDEGER